MNKHTLRFIWGLITIVLSISCLEVACNPMNNIYLRMVAMASGIGTFVLGHRHIEKAINE